VSAFIIHNDNHDNERGMAVSDPMMRHIWTTVKRLGLFCNTHECFQERKRAIAQPKLSLKTTLETVVAMILSGA
jgi:hypothetical protein